MKTVTDVPSYFPIITDKDYKFGKIKRYFCIKNNITPLPIKEISGDDYSELKNRTDKFSYSLYDFFDIEWIVYNDNRELAIKKNSLQLLKYPELKLIIKDPLQFFKK